jgi:hypothetical protein
MNRPPADERDEGENEVATSEPQISSQRDDVLPSFDPFSDVFSSPPFSTLHEHASAVQTFDDSRPEDAWTDNERGRSLSVFLESDNPGVDPLWWNENMLSSPTTVEESNTASMRRDFPATAAQLPLGQLEGGSVVSKEWRPVDNNEILVENYKDNPLMETVEGRPRMAVQIQKEQTRQPKETDQEHTATTKEQPGDCLSGGHMFSQHASIGNLDDILRPAIAQTAIVENVVTDMSPAASALPMRPSWQEPFTLTPKRRRWTSGSDPDMRSKRLKRSTASIPSISEEIRLPIREPYPAPQSLYPLPPIPPQYSDQISENFSNQAGDTFLTSDSGHRQAPGLESAYPDPSMYAISSRQEPWEQAQTAPYHSPVNNYPSSIRTGLRSRRGRSLDIGSVSTRHGPRPTARRQLAHPGVEPNVDRGKFDWPGQEPPDLTNISTWPPPFPAMDRPGPGGPGTWASDWIELRSRRTQMKYPQFARGTDRIPGRHPLQTYCYWFPNHVRDEGLDHFRAEGWSGRKIWDHYHPNAVEECRVRAEKDDGKLADRPWNFLQQWLSRRKRQVEKEGTGASYPQDAASQSEDSSEDDAFRRVKRRPGQPQLNIAPSTPSMRMTKRASGQVSQFRPEPSLGQNAGHLLSNPNTGLALTVKEESQLAFGRARHIQNATSQPWWQKQLMIQVERVRRVLGKIYPRFDQQQYRTQILEADLYLRRHFPMFARRVWLQVLPGLVVPQNNLHPMMALRDIYGQLRRIDHSMQLPDEQRFCDEMMERYMREISNLLTIEEHRLHGPPAVNSAISPYVDIGAFQHPRGSLHGFQSDDPNNVQSGALLLQQPLFYHDMGQHQHDSNITATERSLADASLGPRAISSEVQGHAAQSYPIDQPDLNMRAAALPVTGSSLRDTRPERQPQQLDSEEDDAPEQYLSLLEGHQKPG